jgi:hypothetical protein
VLWQDRGAGFIKATPTLDCMLPETLQELLKTQFRYVNPNGTEFSNVYDYRFKDFMRCFDKYQEFLSACGHDTRELAGAVARARAAIQELRHVNEWMDDRFRQDPFPVMAAGDTIDLTAEGP